ncbi:MAG: ribonuclease E/G, partial [Eubacterium sp.]|nr:ribonuclease E/G [Eubacterium sp.]
MKKLLITKLQLQHPSSRQAGCFHACALYENGRLTELSLYPSDTGSILNNIYIAKVKNVVANLDAAFVEIARGELCYLPLENLKHPVFTKKLSKQPIAAGEELAVQVIKEAVKSKDAVVSANLSFAGEFLVLTSGNLKTGVSSKVSGEQRRRLQGMLQKLCEKEPKLCREFGVILRTNAAQAGEDAIYAEFDRLKKQYQDLTALAATRTLYSCLRKERPFYLKILMDTDKSGLEEVITDDPQIFSHIKECAAASYTVRLYEDKLLPLASLYRLAGQAEAALKPRVWLKSGANIVIQPTEALTVIDVNSGKNTAKKDKQRNHYAINLEAAREIAFQLRLRNISGIIIVDFIDLYDEALEAELLNELRNCLKKDPVPATVVDITKLGLVEI